MEQGFGVPHIIEIDMLVGPGFRKDPPASYMPCEINHHASPVTQKYRTSIIGTFDLTGPA